MHVSTDEGMRRLSPSEKFNEHEASRCFTHCIFISGIVVLEVLGELVMRNLVGWLLGEACY